MRHLIIIAFTFFSLQGLTQTFSTYENAYDEVIKSSKTKGFKAVEDKYSNCKHMKTAKLRKVDEQINKYTGRMEIKIIWDYTYLGCYFKIDKYSGAAKVKYYITQNEDGNFKYGYQGVEVLSWDPDN